MEPLTYLPSHDRSFYYTPFQRAQTLLQTQDLIPTFKDSKPLGGFIDTFRTIRRKETFPHLWKSGFPAAILGISDLIFAETMKSASDQLTMVGQGEGFKFILNTPNILTSAFVVCWNAIFHPLEIIRVRMCCNNFGLENKGFDKFSTMYQQIKQKEGIKGFYRGFSPITTYMVIQRYFFEQSLKYKEMTPGQVVFRFIWDMASYPLLVIGHRMIIDKQNRFKGMVEYARRMLGTTGWKGFYRGFQLNLCLHSLNLLALNSDIPMQSQSQ